MKEENYKKLYTCLLDTEDLHRMFPKLTGVWEADKKKFIQYQTELENLANITEIEND